MYNPACHTVSGNVNMISNDHSYHTNRKLIPEDAGIYNVHIDPYMKHVYTEIPLSPLEVQHEPLQTHDVTDVEHGTNRPEAYNGDTIYIDGINTYLTENIQYYPDITSTEANIKNPDANSEAYRTDKSLNNEMYAEVKKSDCCTRQVTVHVIVMALAGIVYMGIGGIAGFYFHRRYASDEDLVSVTPGYTTSQKHMPTMPSSIIDKFTTREMDNITKSAEPAITTEPMKTTESTLCSPDGRMCKCGPVGGNAGRVLSHRDQWMRYGNVSGFTVQHNEYFIGWLQFKYGTSSVTTDTKLGYTDSGYQVQITMGKDEFIQELLLDFTLAKTFLTRVLVQTNLRKFGPFGGEGAQRFTVRGSKLLFVEGQAGPLVNQLTAYFDKCS